MPYDDLKRSQKRYHLVNFLAEKNAGKPRISSVFTTCCQIMKRSALWGNPLS